MTIRFAKYDFDGPYAAAGWTAPTYGGIYAVMVHDPAYNPLPYRVIYFGQAHDLSSRGLLRAHPKYADWLAAGGNDRGLYIATYGMPGSSELTRLAVETHLVHHYQLECNEPFTSLGPPVTKTLRTHKHN
jgi:hypothetical protein